MTVTTPAAGSILLSHLVRPVVVTSLLWAKLPKSIRTTARGVNPLFFCSYVNLEVSDFKLVNGQKLKPICCIYIIVVLWYIHSQMYVNLTPVNSRTYGTKNQTRSARNAPTHPRCGSTSFLTAGGIIHLAGRDCSASWRYARLQSTAF